MFTPANVNIQRVRSEIDALSQFGHLESGGTTRYTFSDAHVQASRQVAFWMAEADLDVRYDPWGNLYGRTTGVIGTRGVLTGSHIDSVPNGGNYDGPLGVLSSLEAVRMILESDRTLQKPIEVVAFIEEEGARWFGLLGSTLAAGRMGEEQIANLTDRDGNRFLDVLSQVDFGYPIDTDSDLPRRTSHYIELHIEQGRRLEAAAIPVGVVTAIAGPNFMQVRLTGRADHAGATAYENRYDTLLAASEIVLRIRELGQSKFPGRGHMTVGRMVPHPNVVNVVAGETEFSVDFRADTDETAAEMRTAVEHMVEAVARNHHLTYEIPSVQSVNPAPTPAYLQEAVTIAAQQAGVEAMDIISWAAHDAMVMANIADSAMIFVPCRDGRSHCPEEHVYDTDIAAGIATLANTLIQLAG